MNIKTSRFGKSLIGIGLLALMCSLLSCALFVRVYAAPTSAMVPEFARGQRVVVESLTYLIHDPARGDVIAFTPDWMPTFPAKTINFKRVVGLPGERVRIEQGRLLVDGVEVGLSNRLGRISYEGRPGTPGMTFTNTTLLPGQYFVLGDNSTNSFDSRYWGHVPRSAIRGRAWVRGR